MGKTFFNSFIIFFLIFTHNSYAKKITAKELVGEYIKNSALADKKYSNKKVDVTGYVNKIRKTVFLSSYIEMNAHEDSYDKYFIHAFPAERFKKTLERLKKNEHIRVIGTCKGKTFFGNIKIVNCRILTKKKRE
jgi:hypothetical protein